VFAVRVVAYVSVCIIYIYVYIYICMYVCVYIHIYKYMQFIISQILLGTRAYTGSV
jgi:hypothetical protein